MCAQAAECDGVLHAPLHFFSFKLTKGIYGNVIINEINTTLATWSLAFVLGERCILCFYLDIQWGSTADREEDITEYGFVS